MREEATSGAVYHHATVEAIREGMLHYVSSSATDGEPAADAVAGSLAEDLQMDDETTDVAEILAHAGIGPDDIEAMIDEGLRKLAAAAATRVQRVDPAKLPVDCQGTLTRLRARAWQKSADEAAETGGGQYPPAHLRSQLGRAAWDGYGEDAPVTGREAIEIHFRTPGSRLLVRKPDGPEPVSVEDAWKVIEGDPGAVYVAT